MSSQQHLLSLKVLRLSKPSFEIRDGLENSQYSGIDLVDCLSLPAAFGNIYLGETFTSYLCLNNDSSTPVADFSFKAELQTGKERFTLADTNQTVKTTESLLPHQSSEFMLHHEIKELGIHILVCSVHYQPSIKDAQKTFFRKFFKFQVLNPLSVKTKLHTFEHGVIYLEIQVQNLATIALSVEKLDLKPSSSFVSTSMVNSEANDENSSPNSPNKPNTTKLEKVFDGMLFQPQDIRQYLFILTPSNRNTLVNLATDLGHLDITWRTNLGQIGHLETAPLIRKEYPISPVQVTLLNQPMEVELEKELKLKFKIQNNLDGQKMNLTLNFKIDKNDPVVLVGKEATEIGPLNGMESMEWTFDFLPMETGIHNLPPMHISDSLSTFSCDLSTLGSIYVT